MLGAPGDSGCIGGSPTSKNFIMGLLATHHVTWGHIDSGNDDASVPMYIHDGGMTAPPSQNPSFLQRNCQFRRGTPLRCSQIMANYNDGFQVVGDIHHRWRNPRHAESPCAAAGHVPDFLVLRSAKKSSWTRTPPCLATLWRDQWRGRRMLG